MLGSCSPCCKTDCERLAPHPSTFSDIAITMNWSSFFVAQRFQVRISFLDPGNTYYASTAFHGDRFSGTFQLTRQTWPEAPGVPYWRYEFPKGDFLEAITNTLQGGTFFSYVLRFGLFQRSHYPGLSPLYKNYEDLYDTCSNVSDCINMGVSSGNFHGPNLEREYVSFGIGITCLNNQSVEYRTYDTQGGIPIGEQYNYPSLPNTWIMQSTINNEQTGGKIFPPFRIPRPGDYYSWSIANLEGTLSNLFYMTISDIQFLP